MWRRSSGSPSVKYCWVAFTWRLLAPCTDKRHLSRAPRSAVQVPAEAPLGGGTPSPGFVGQGAGERVGLQRRTQVEPSGAPPPDTRRSQYVALAWASAAGSGYGSPAAEGPALRRPRSAPARQPRSQPHAVPGGGARQAVSAAGAPGAGPRVPFRAACCREAPPAASASTVQHGGSRSAPARGPSTRLGTVTAAAAAGAVAGAARGAPGSLSSGAAGPAGWSHGRWGRGRGRDPVPEDCKRTPRIPRERALGSPSVVWAG